ncbi:hypothetical protein KA005_49365, partial [bacterium]|nr:hypothetical protein [bacterium]
LILYFGLFVTRLNIFHAYRLSLLPQLYSLIVRQYVDIIMFNHGSKTLISVFKPKCISSPVLTGQARQHLQ